MTVRFVARQFWSPKLGNSEDEFEDAFAVTGKFAVTGYRQPATRSGNYAIADGATMASFCGEWARLLVQDYVTQGPIKAGRLQSRLDPLQCDWVVSLADRELPWYAAEKLKHGAFATLLGLTLRGRIDASRQKYGQWTAWAAGDSCLFHVRAHELHCDPFPIAASSEFGYHPKLLTTNLKANPEEAEISRLDGDWRVGDTFFLMTDALAEWFLQSVESGERPWLALEQLTSNGGDSERCFRSWIDHQRETHVVHNDDVTLVIVEVDDDDLSSSST